MKNKKRNKNTNSKRKISSKNNNIKIKEKGKKNKGPKIKTQKDVIDNLEKTSNLNLNWYPGHMFKTKEELKEIIKKVDIVLEVLDARIPFSSSNADLKEIIKEKSKIIILNKSDLADDQITEEWIKNLEDKEKCPVLKVNSTDNKDVNKVKTEIKNAEIVKEKTKKALEKGMISNNINVMVVGIPNVGKSTIINKIVGKNSQDVKNLPGVTKTNRWIRTKDNINILDTPGVLVPKLEENIGINLAIIGSIKSDLFDKVEIASYLLKTFIRLGYIKNLSERYNLDIKYLDELKKIQANINIQKIKIKDNEDELNKLEDLYFTYNIKIYELMKNIGANRGFVRKGNEVDDEKTASIILNEYQKGMLGKITLERSFYE